MVIRYRGTPQSLAVAKGSAHTHVIMSPLLVNKVGISMIDSRTLSVGGLLTDNALECDDMLLQQNIFTCEILVLYTS